tara:strand:- start:411 stop:917 length:507 start_codon:yes stop_codon:yes gene_type:complete
MQTLISKNKISERISVLAREIHQDHKNGLHFVCLLKGGVLFLADLIRALPGQLTLDFMAVSSYGNNLSSTGEIKLLKDLDISINGKSVVIVEDIVDSGATLAYVQKILLEREPKSLRTACLLRKKNKHRSPIEINYVGFDIEDQFVVGYGLDYAEHYRNLPFIGIIKN